jgi:pSer/pThr/pTyr-binding forkhead associated (FHA) protein
MSRELEVTRHLGEEDLARGVLLGRYDRCVERFDANEISRVHLLIARVGGDLVAIDTASTNGSFLVHHEDDFAIAKLEDRAVLNLANVGLVLWRGRPRGSA